jgi:hypothetical protein
MLITDFKVGDKVVPHSKKGKTVYFCSQIDTARTLKQPFLYIARINEDRIIVLSWSPTETIGNHYLCEDLTLYQEPTVQSELTELPEALSIVRVNGGRPFTASESASYTARLLTAKNEVTKAEKLWIFTKQLWLSIKMS